MIELQKQVTKARPKTRYIRFRIDGKKPSYPCVPQATATYQWYEATQAIRYPKNAYQSPHHNLPASSSLTTILCTLAAIRTALAPLLTHKATA